MNFSFKCTLRGSNPRPSQCKCAALPTELRVHHSIIALVGMGRLELPSLATYASETYAYTNSATCPSLRPYYMKGCQTQTALYFRYILLAWPEKGGSHVPESDRYHSGERVRADSIMHLRLRHRGHHSAMGWLEDRLDRFISRASLYI